MSKSPDKRRRTDLDLFVLALIDGGISTPYDLQKSAGLSQGATIPALQRLLDARAVRQGKPGIRGRTSYKLSATGRKLVRDGWRPLIAAGPCGDLDSDLRIGLLAIWGGGDRGVAADFLRQSADKKAQSIVSDELPVASDAVAPLARWYTDLRFRTAKALLAAESDAILAMSQSLPRKLTSKPKHGTRTPNSSDATQPSTHWD